AGTATITATTTDGTNLSDSTTITVAALIHPTKVVVGPSCASVKIGAQLQMTATITPANASIKDVVWTSAKPNIATVDANGVVTGIAAGTSKITATTVDGAKTDYETVTVKKK
ncbi:MAG: Ig-like domain-containing protein, partial [Bifidobacteriaceae bacterium]|nr:Ig-like domain-containing protein [Bifidobacteriaceae bacterium]